jgi:hypothetical protein
VQFSAQSFVRCFQRIWRRLWIFFKQIVVMHMSRLLRLPSWKMLKKFGSTRFYAFHRNFIFFYFLKKNNFSRKSVNHFCLAKIQYRCLFTIKSQFYIFYLN